MWTAVTPKSLISLIWRRVFPAPGGNGHAAEALRAVVDAKSSGEQSVAGHVLKGVFPADACGKHAAGHEIGPCFHVFPRIADGHGGAGGAAGTVHAHKIGAGNAAQAIRILGAQIVLAGEGQTADILGTGDILRRQARLIQNPRVEGSLAGLRDNRPQASGLFLADAIRAPCFGYVVIFHLMGPWAGRVA